MTHESVGSSLYLGDRLIWSNPPELGHAFIRLRKDIYEQRLIETLRYYWRAEDRWEDDGGSVEGRPS